MTGRLKSFFKRAPEKDNDNNNEIMADVRVRQVNLNSRLADTGDAVRKFVLGDKITLILISAILAVLMIGVFGYWLYNRMHVFDDYEIIESAEENDVEGTEYAMLGKRVIKYSHDGAFCVDTRNEVQWSTAYSMQTPICETCGSAMVIAEQQGEQVFVVKTDGVLGSFRTRYPILQAHVSESGIVALVLEDSDVTWINLYDANGSEIVSVKTTVADSGYPVDVAVTPNARQMMVSYIGVENAELCGTIAFYDFSSASENDESHLKGSIKYLGSVFPDVYYASGKTPVAVSDDGFIVFSQEKTPSEKHRVAFENEIVSVFHDDDNIGFIFQSEDAAIKYDMVIYNYNGRSTMETNFNFTYTGVRMENGEILLYNASNLFIYRTSGKQKLKVTYEKEVKFFTSLSGMKRYLVVSGNSMDRIRIR